MTTFARIVVAKTIKNPIPNRLEPLDQQRLRQRNPNIIDGQELAIEVFKAEVRGGIHRFCMVIESLVECSSRVDVVTLSTFSRTIGYCFAYINGAGKLVVAVNFCKCLICGKIPNIIKCIHICVITELPTAFASLTGTAFPICLMLSVQDALNK